MRSTYRPRRQRRATCSDPADQLAVLFLENELSYDLHVAIRGIDDDGDLLEWPGGQWLRVVDYGNDGKSMVGVEISPFEVRSLIYRFLVKCNTEISTTRVIDVEQLCKFAMIERDARTLTYPVEVRKWRREAIR